MWLAFLNACITYLNVFHSLSLASNYTEKEIDVAKIYMLCLLCLGMRDKLEKSQSLMLNCTKNGEI